LFKDRYLLQILAAGIPSDFHTSSDDEGPLSGQNFTKLSSW
jgi:hypothetical protein